MSEEPREARHMRVRTYPDEILKGVAAPVGRDRLDEETAFLARCMARTMYDEKGIGLAAPQVGAPLRLVVINRGVLSPSEDDPSPLILVNPVIVDSSGREVAEEGCLSLPGVNANVRRKARATVEFETLTGERTGLDLEGLAARVAQHEIDHLDGTLFVDRLGPAGRLAVRKALRELVERARTPK